MSRRETFRESARAANDQSLGLSSPGPSEAERGTVDLSPILNGLAELERRLEAIEQRLPAHSGQREVRRSPRATLAWVLGTVLITLLAITALRPDWALRPRQRAELLLGGRLYQRLQHMEERDRLEVLRSLWSEPPAAPGTND
jgi:hypothetical protein